MLTKLPQAAIFDMDGLMIDSETIYVSTWHRALLEFGYTCEEEFVANLVGCDHGLARQKHYDTFGADMKYEDVSAHFIGYYNDELAKGIPLMPGIIELLKWLKSKNIPCAVATSSHRVGATDKLTRGGLIDFFGAIVCGDEVENGKPAPDIFLKAAAKLGAQPEHCLVLEDSPFGILAAHRASMHSFLVPNMAVPGPDTLEMASHKFDSLVDALAYLKTLQ